MKYFITAIGTDSGKTVVSAIFAEALAADYWKPIQAGFPRDTDEVKKLVSNLFTTYHKEAYLLNTPASPHAAAKIDKVKIDIKKIAVPMVKSDLIIEGAGGLMVPLNDHDLVIDIAKQEGVEIILVCNLYLGSINHSLLSLDYLKNHGFKLRGVVFNGVRNTESEGIILKYAEVPCLLRVRQEEVINKAVVRRYAEQLKNNLKNE